MQENKYSLIRLTHDANEDIPEDETSNEDPEDDVDGWGGSVTVDEIPQHPDPAIQGEQLEQCDEGLLHVPEVRHTEIKGDLLDFCGGIGIHAWSTLYIFVENQKKVILFCFVSQKFSMCASWTKMGCSVT